MTYKVVIDYGWHQEVLFYSSAQAAKNVLYYAKKDGYTARAYMQHGLAWILWEE